MDPLIIAYLILGGVMCFALLIVILKVAGKEMFFAFGRFFQPRGSDVFLVDPSNNHVNQFYKVAREEHFIIEKEIYLTNPYKLQGLQQDFAQKVKASVEADNEKIRNYLKDLKVKKILIEKKINTVPDKPENIQLIQQLQIQFNALAQQIETTESKLEKRTLSFFRLRRPVYFYIKGDPVPKDFINLYTEMDCIQLENIISRAQTKDPKSLTKMEKDITLIKKLVFVIIIGLAIACWLSFNASNVAQQIAQQQGVILTV